MKNNNICDICLTDVKREILYWTQAEVLNLKKIDFDKDKILKFLLSRRDNKIFNIEIQKSISLDFKTSHKDTEIIHHIFYTYMGITKKCQGCILNLKKRIFSLDVITNESIEKTCSEFSIDVLKKAIKKNVPRGTK